jgi:hypothetical protein
MKRVKVTVDPQLLEAARHVTPERTDEAIVNKGLEELVRVANLKRGIKAMRDTDDVFWPNYLEEIRPNSNAAYEKRLAPRRGTR